MSWSIGPFEGSVRDVMARVEAASLAPQPIRDYAAAGISGLVNLYGEDVQVRVLGSGHLCSGTDYDVTSANIEIRRLEGPAAVMDVAVSDPAPTTDAPAVSGSASADDAAAAKQAAADEEEARTQKSKTAMGSKFS